MSLIDFLHHVAIKDLLIVIVPGLSVNLQLAEYIHQGAG